MESKPEDPCVKVASMVTSCVAALAAAAILFHGGHPIWAVFILLLAI